MYEVPVSRPNLKDLTTLLVGKRYETKNCSDIVQATPTISPTLKPTDNVSNTKPVRMYQPVYKLESDPLSPSLSPQPLLTAPLAGIKANLFPKCHFKQEWVPSEAVVGLSKVKPYNHINAPKLRNRKVHGLPPLVKPLGEVKKKHDNSPENDVSKCQRNRSSNQPRNPSRSPPTLLPFLNSKQKSQRDKEGFDDTFKNSNKIRKRGVTESGALYSVSAHTPTRSRLNGQKPSLGIFNLIDIQLFPRKEESHENKQYENKDRAFQKTLATLDQSNETKCMLRPWSSKDKLREAVLKSNILTSIASPFDSLFLPSFLGQQQGDALERASCQGQWGCNTEMAKNLTLHIPLNGLSPTYERGDSHRVPDLHLSLTEKEAAKTGCNHAKFEQNSKVQRRDDQGKISNTFLGKAVAENGEMPKDYNEDKPEGVDLSTSNNVKAEKNDGLLNESAKDTNGINASAIARTLDNINLKSLPSDNNITVTWCLQNEENTTENLTKDCSPLAPVIGRKIPQDRQNIILPPGHTVVKTAWFRPQVGESVLDRLAKPPPRLLDLRPKISRPEKKPREGSKSLSNRRQKQRRCQIYAEPRKVRKETLKYSTVNIQLGGNEDEKNAFEDLNVQDLTSFYESHMESPFLDNSLYLETTPAIKEEKTSLSHASQMSKFVRWNDTKCEIQEVNSEASERHRQMNFKKKSLQANAMESSVESGLIVDKTSGRVISLDEKEWKRQRNARDIEILVCQECNAVEDEKFDERPESKLSVDKIRRRRRDFERSESKEVYKINMKGPENALCPWSSQEVESWTTDIDLGNKRYPGTETEFINNTSFTFSSDSHTEVVPGGSSATEISSPITAISASCDKISSLGLISKSEDEPLSISCKIRISKSDDEIHNKTWRRQKTPGSKGCNSVVVSEKSCDSKRKKNLSKISLPSDSRQHLCESEAEHFHYTSPVPDNYESHCDIQRSQSLPILSVSPDYKETKKLQAGFVMDINTTSPKTFTKKGSSLLGSSFDITSDMDNCPNLNTGKFSHAQFETSHECDVGPEDSSEDDIVVITDHNGRHLFESRKKEELVCGSSSSSSTIASPSRRWVHASVDTRESVQQEQSLNPRLDLPSGRFLYHPEVTGNRNESQKEMFADPKFLFYSVSERENAPPKPIKKCHWGTQISKISRHPLLQSDKVVEERAYWEAVANGPPPEENYVKQSNMERKLFGDAVCGAIPLGHWEVLGGWQERSCGTFDEREDLETFIYSEERAKPDHLDITSNDVNEILDMRRSKISLNPAIGKCRMHVKGRRLSQAPPGCRGDSTEASDVGTSVAYGICENCKAMEKFLEQRAKAMSEALQATRRDEPDGGETAGNSGDAHATERFCDICDQRKGYIKYA